MKTKTRAQLLAEASFLKGLMLREGISDEKIKDLQDKVRKVENKIQQLNQTQLWDTKLQ